MTPRYIEATGLVARTYEGQVRKGRGASYILHPVTVAVLVAQYGGDEDQQIARLLHDVLDDGGPHYAEVIDRRFGPRVPRIVEACTDGGPDATDRKSPWKERKARYIEHLRHAPDDVLLVSGCGKLHNGHSILDNLESIGIGVLNRFKASQQAALWYYLKFAKVFEERQMLICNEFTATVVAMHSLAGHLLTKQVR